MSTTTLSIRILRIRAVVNKLGVARSTIYDWINPRSPRYDATFPKQRRLGMQSVGWLESELDTWLLERQLASSTGIAERP
ncbi:AlpA family phage regulatory protein [Citrobacter telavivensis]